MTYFTTNLEYPFGIDISKYNTSQDGKQKVDFDIIKAHVPKVQFSGIRAGISWAYQDPWFSYYMTECERVGIRRMPYHVIYPAESAEAQVSNLMRIVGGYDLNHVRLVLDMELVHNCGRIQITDTLNKSLVLLKARTGRLPIIYSRTGWVNEHLIVSALPKLDWWLAQYRSRRPSPLYTPEYPCPPSPLPSGVDSWLIMQTAEGAPGIGSPGNRYMDYNRWNFEVDMTEYFDEVDSTILSLEEKVDILCEAHPELFD